MSKVIKSKKLLHDITSSDFENQLKEINGRRRHRIVSMNKIKTWAGELVGQPEAACRINGGWVAKSYSYPAVTTVVFLFAAGSRILGYVDSREARRSVGRWESEIVPLTAIKRNMADWSHADEWENIQKELKAAAKP